MTARKPTAEQRICEAHDRLLASKRTTPDMPDSVREALYRTGDFIEACVLAGLIGHLGGRAANGKPISPTKLAEIVEEVCVRGEQHAARVIATSTPKETDR